MGARRQEAGWKAASPAGRRAPSTKTQKTEGGEDENAFLGLAGEGVTVDLEVCVCVWGGGVLVAEAVASQGLPSLWYTETQSPEWRQSVVSGRGCSVSLSISSGRPAHFGK